MWLALKKYSDTPDRVFSGVLSLTWHVVPPSGVGWKSVRGAGHIRSRDRIAHVCPLILVCLSIHPLFASQLTEWRWLQKITLPLQSLFRPLCCVTVHPRSVDRKEKQRFRSRIIAYSDSRPAKILRMSRRSCMKGRAFAMPYLDRRRVRRRTGTLRVIWEAHAAHVYNL